MSSMQTLQHKLAALQEEQVTQAVWNAKLKLEGENLVWYSLSPQGSNDYFPNTVKIDLLNNAA